MTMFTLLLLYCYYLDAAFAPALSLDDDDDDNGNDDKKTVDNIVTR